MGWIETYLDYTAAQESPEEFHLFSGLTTIAAVMNRRTWLQRTTRDGVSRYKIWPGQLATVLVADSGFLRKTTAIDIAHEFMKSANVRLFEGKISHERLLTKLGSFKDGNAILTVIAGELETLLSKSAYHDGLIGSLTKLFDGRDDAYETIKGGSISLKNISFTVLAATNPKSIGNALPSQSQEQGFQSRWLYVYSGKSSKKPDPATTDPSSIAPDQLRARFQQKTDLEQGLKKIALLQGEFKLSSDAKTWYDDWYQDYVKVAAVDKPGWPARRGDHLTRIGMLLEASATGQTEVASGSLQAADALLSKYVEAHFARTFAFIGRHSSADQQDRILDVFRLYQNGHPISLSEIVFRTRRFFKNADELRQTLQFLNHAGMLRMVGIDISGDEKWSMIKDDR